MAIDENRGILYIADSENHRVRQMGSDGVIFPFAGGEFGFAGDGGPAIDAELSTPLGLAVDSQGSLYIADFLNSVIRRVGRDGIINRFAGVGFGDPSVDNVPATESPLMLPSDVAVDALDNVYIADPNDHRIRRVGTDGNDYHRRG